VIIGGYSSSVGITYSDNTTLFTLSFNYLGGTTDLTWFDSGASCEYADFPNYNTLNDLPFATYYVNGQVGPGFQVDFTADKLLPEAGETVTFSSLVTGTPTAWNWSFTPATFVFVNGTSQGSQNPQVQFTTNGSYNASLAATQGTCTIPTLKSNFIHAGTKGLWTGTTSSDWNISTNWNNFLVPESTIDVVIPASSVNWPVYDGNLTIGTQCRSLKIEGTTSFMTITGNLVILPPTP
jgi:PKD repeat protein